MVTMIQIAKAKIAKLQFSYLNHVNNLKIFEKIQILPKNLHDVFFEEAIYLRQITSLTQ